MSFEKGSPVPGAADTGSVSERSAQRAAIATPRTPRQWPPGSPEPMDVAEVRSDQNDIVFRARDSKMWGRDWLATPESTGDGQYYRWSQLNGLSASEGPMTLSEVLPETPEPPQEGSYFDRTSFADEEAEAARAALVPVPASQSVPAAPDSADLRADLVGALADTIRASVPTVVRWDEAVEIAGALLDNGWRPPLPKAARVSLRAVVAGAIGEHTGEEEDHEVAANYAAAQALIDRGWLDPVGEIGPPEPVATTLRRIIRDLEDQAAGPQRHTHAGIALSQYADRLRGHPVLDADADAGWPPLPDEDTLRGELCAVTAQRDDAQRAGLKFVGQLNEIRALLPIKHIDDLDRIAVIVGWPAPSSPLPDSETERPRRCPALVPEGNVITEGRQCQQYEGHAHDHTWYGDNGRAYSLWAREATS